MDLEALSPGGREYIFVLLCLLARLDDQGAFCFIEASCDQRPRCLRIYLTVAARDRKTSIRVKPHVMRFVF